MVNALRDVAGEEVAARVKWQYDPAIDRIVSTWPSNFAPKLGPAIGMRADADFAGIVRAYMADDMPLGQRYTTLIGRASTLSLRSRQHARRRAT